MSNEKSTQEGKWGGGGVGEKVKRRRKLGGWEMCSVKSQSI